MAEKPATNGNCMYGHGMLVFLKPGQEHSVELLREEKERRIILHKKRIALLGEEEAKKLQQEDYEREQRLLDRVLEKQTLDTPLSISELPVDPKIEEMPATLGSYTCCFGYLSLSLSLSLSPRGDTIDSSNRDYCLLYFGRMLVFPKPGQEHSMELLGEERGRRLLLHKNRIALLGEEEAEKLQKEDHEREQHLLDQIHKEGSAKREKTERRHYLGPEFVELTPTQRLDYEKRLRESGGFDVGDIPACVSNIPVRPFVLGSPMLVKMIEGYAKSALDQHNKHNNTKYQFVKVLKANIGGYSPGWTYYITSQVKDMAGSGSPTLNFQAEVNSLEDQEAVTTIVPEP
ncbi:hypothetical protein RHSIM_RhsimUnG0120300 [Rhododendron simsii]|uniref:Uncharacterized protein n=1 Tax=Rhododendron simsii TaxID=118357 RepID=A0A834L2I9_RHOSS|nr:hypothetical protein RHSIM_RhsimUnG0120300 [Rhododendron simsii]